MVLFTINYILHIRNVEKQNCTINVQCVCFFKILMNSKFINFLFDQFTGETMLSPLVMCGPQALEFLVPVTLNIPHYASKTASLGLSLKATDSEQNLETNWDNIELPSNTAAHTVSVKVDHF